LHRNGPERAKYNSPGAAPRAPPWET